MEKECPYYKSPCVGEKCSEFVPRYHYKGYYNEGIQDVIEQLKCWLLRKTYNEPFYIGTICAHCRQNISAAWIWDEEKYADLLIYDEKTGMRS